MILNMLSTCTMIKLGKVYSNLMVDVKSSNKKLEERARRILMEATNCDRQTAIDTLAITQGKVKPAILMLLANISYEEALSSLNNNEGFISKSLNSMKNNCEVSMNLQQTAFAIYELMKSFSILKITNCMTRLRLQLNTEDIANLPLKN